MRCSACNTPIEPQMRFCPKCGEPTTTASTGPQAEAERPIDDRTTKIYSSAQPWTLPPQTNASDSPVSWVPTQPVNSYPPQRTPMAPTQPDAYQEQPTYIYPSSQAQGGALPSQGPAYTQNNTKGENMSQARIQPTTRRTRPRNRLGCLVSFLTVLVLLVLVVGAGFIFFLRPYAQSQLDQAMSTAVKNIPETAALLPPGPLTVNENFLTNIITVNLAPSDPVKNPKATIKPSGVRMDIEIYGQPCSMEGTPELVNGQLKATNVKVNGLISLLISPEEATTMLNRHLNEAQVRLKHTLQKVELKDGLLELTLGAPILG